MKFPAVKVLVSAFFLLAFQSMAIGKPPLWKLSDEDTTIYLLGTFHLLKKETVWYTHEIDDALKGSDALYLEITLREIDGSDAWAYIRARGFFPKGTYLSDYIGERDFYRLQELISLAGGNPNMVLRMKPMMAAEILAGAPYLDEGLSRALGAEETLVRRALKFNVPVKGLTDLKTHLGATFDYSVETQVGFLKETMKLASKDLPDVDYYINAWKKGDLSAMSIHEYEALNAFPEIKEKLLNNRNQIWVDQIVEMMKTPGQIFIAVGAGHFTGSRNVIELLEKVGLKPVRQ